MSRHSSQRSMGSALLSTPHFSGNSKFGAMFLWSGCICQALWALASVTARAGLTLGDFAPLFVYSALATAGIALIVSHPVGRGCRPDGNTDDTAQVEGIVTEARPLETASNSQEKGCRVMTIGSLAPVQKVLSQLLDRSLLVEHVETAGQARQHLASLSAEDVPDILIMPWWLPIIRSSDFIREIKSDPALRSINVIVWGRNIPAKQIRSLYEAGTTCVIVKQFDEKLSQALVDLCTMIERSKSPPW